MVLTLQQRAEIGAQAFANPCIAALGRRYKCHRHSIVHWLEQGKKPHPNYCVAAGRGRKPILSKAERTRVRKLARATKPATKIMTRINRNRKCQVSLSTIRQCIKSGRFEVRWLPLTRSKALSDTNKQMRLQFCTANPRPAVNTWVFLDAKFLYLYNDGTPFVHYCWQRMGEELPIQATEHPTVFMFYGAVARGHKSRLYFVPPTPAIGSNRKKNKDNFCSRHFVEMLERMKVEIDDWFPDGRYVIIRDHASQHTSHESKAAIKRMGVHIKEDYPPQSWDLNIIENVWGVLDQNLQGRRPVTNDGWRDAIQHAWDAVSITTINKLVAHVKGRMSDVVTNMGDLPKHSK